MLVVKPVRSNTFLATLSVLVVVAGTLVGANVASADSVQYQSYQRASQTEACTAQVGETPWQASWGTDSSWYPSWDQWANGGKGGWTCGRSITWAKTPVAGGSSSARTYALGETGPGGGLVFLISGGLTYEMAPKTWGANETTGIEWCNNTSSDVTGAVGTAVGTGSANTTALDAACTSGAGQSAADYAANGLSDWFLPSLDELNAMCNYSRNPTAPAAPIAFPGVGCFGPAGSGGSTQNVTFAAGTYGFANNGNYWNSSQHSNTTAWYQDWGNGARSFNDGKFATLRVRPVRAF